MGSARRVGNRAPVATGQQKAGRRGERVLPVILLLWLRAAALLLAFTLPFGLYLATLAPTVTLEDSGELIAAAHTLGVPHSPGYPLFTMLGKLFSLLPLGNVAYRLNLMSAFFSSLAALFVAWTTASILERSTWPADPLKWAAALTAGLWFGTSFEVWEQSILTEVYALNAAVVCGFFLLLALRWRGLSSDRLFDGQCFTLGLALTTHSTSLILIPLFALNVARTGPPPGARLGRSIRAAVFFLAGLGPYLYLPLASLRDPAMDWGDPETPASLFRTLFVRHHRLSSWPAPGEYLERLQAFGALLAEQWMAALLLLALLGLAAAFRTNRNFFWHALAFLALSGPAVTLLTNIDVSASDPRVAAENLAQVSVFYIPCYALISILMGVGVFAAARFALPHAWARAFAAAVVLAPLLLAPRTCRAVDMSQYHLAEDYAGNLFGVAAQNAVVFADWDPFYFPLVYSQIVEGRRPDLLLLDQHLLRRSWYVEQLRDRRPAASAAAKPEIDAFLQAVRVFEAGEPYDGREIQRRYEALLRALVDRSVEQGRSVYFTYDPPPALVLGYSLESLLVARRLTREPRSPTPLDAAALRFRGVLEGNPLQDRWSRVFADYYGTLAYERGATVERASDFGGALELYRRAARLLAADHPLLPAVREQIARLERQTGG